MSHDPLWVECALCLTRLSNPIGTTQGVREPAWCRVREKEKRIESVNVHFTSPVAPKGCSMAICQLQKGP